MGANSDSASDGGSRGMVVLVRVAEVNRYLRHGRLFAIGALIVLVVAGLRAILN